MPNHPGAGFGDRAHPPSLAGGAPAYTGVKWTTEYEVDFAAYFAANDGVDWRVAGHTQSRTLLNPGGNNVDWEAYANGSTALNSRTTALEINSNGLQVGNPNENGDTWDTTSDAPRIGPLIADAIGASGGPAYDYAKDIICMQAYITSDNDPMNDNWQNFGIILGTHSTSQGGAWLYARAVANTATNEDGPCASILRKNTSGNIEAAAGSANPNFFEIIVGPRLAAARGRVANWAGSFPEPGAPLSASGWAGLEASAVIKDTEGTVAGADSAPLAATARLEFNSSARNQGGDPDPLTMTVHKVRYLRLR